MGTPFHLLTDTERLALAGRSIAEVAAEHPQPKWCSYPNAVHPLGCWSLTGGKVTGEDYCLDCDLYTAPVQEDRKA